MGRYRKRRGGSMALNRSALESRGAMEPAARFLRTTFYYLRGEQLLKASTRILCRAL